jgi:hypothetical protein
MKAFLKKILDFILENIVIFLFIGFIIFDVHMDRVKEKEAHLLEAQAYDEAYESGYEEGHSDGFDDGYDEGYHDGCKDGAREADSDWEERADEIKYEYYHYGYQDGVDGVEDDMSRW